MTVYVLTSKLEDGEHRPVAVVSDESVADRWASTGVDNDWIPFVLDDFGSAALIEEPLDLSHLTTKPKASLLEPK
jgi:hypothetical protein